MNEIRKLPSVLSRRWLISEWPEGHSVTPAAIREARRFVFEQWIDRAIENGRPRPADLSGACKFSSLFVKALFGGRIRGNFHHQFNMINGAVVDLNADADDVSKLTDPYAHDSVFFGSRDHIESLNSCVVRVNVWVETWNRMSNATNCAIESRMSRPSML